MGAGFLSRSRFCKTAQLSFSLSLRSGPSGELAYVLHAFPVNGRDGPDIAFLERIILNAMAFSVS